jgi:hypothetical protein
VHFKTSNAYPFQYILIKIQSVRLVRPNAVNLTGLVLKLSPCRHSGESRNPGFSGFLDPDHSTMLMAMSQPKGFRRGDAVGKGIILKLTALGPTPIPHFLPSTHTILRKAETFL